MTKLNESRVIALLRDRGVRGLSQLRFAAARPGCTVWDGMLLTPYGDAAFEVLLYALADEPESYVDLQEELEALDNSGSGRYLAKELRDDSWAILITCAVEDTVVIHRFLNEAPEERPSVSYHPQLDRVLGGDYFREFFGKWLKACLAPKDRAMQMPDLLKAAENAYVDGKAWVDKLEHPLPSLIAVVEVPDLEVPGAPPPYDDLVVMQFVVEGKNVIVQDQISSQAALEGFTRQLFGFLATVHRAGICFSRDAGCCIRPEFLLPSGALTDNDHCRTGSKEARIEKASRNPPETLRCGSHDRDNTDLLSVDLFRIRGYFRRPSV